MSRFVHEDGLAERQNMKEAARTSKNGNWCIVGFKDEWEEGFGLQGRRYESESAAKEQAKEIEQEEEFAVVRHEVMTHSEYNEEYARPHNRTELNEN